MWGRGGGEGTPLYKPYRYVPPQRVGLFSPFDLITGVEGGGGYTLPILVWNRNSQEYPPPGTGNWMVYDIAEPFFRDTVFKQ